MATMPAFFRGTKGPQAAPTAASARAERDPFELRALPLEDVYFYSKKIDNSRLVREADPDSGGRCWSAIGVATLALAFTAGVLAPNMANTLAGYKLEALKAEERKLLEQSRVLQLREAELLSPANLERIARERNLVVPSPGQVVHLEPKGESAVAMVKQ